MITIDDLKRVSVLQGFSNEVFNRIVDIAHEQEITEGDVIYEANHPADNVYIVKNGKVVLEEDINEDVTASLASIKPGYIFGWYAMVPSTQHSARAIAAADGHLVVIPGFELRHLMDEDHDFGYQFMNKMYMLAKIRLDHRTEQLMKVLSKHPDLAAGD